LIENYFGTNGHGMTLMTSMFIIRKKYIPKLSEDATSDKERIYELFKNLGIPIFKELFNDRKGQKLKESLLRVHAGWGSNSKMPQVYLHYFVIEARPS
jgi:hypothetical protein